MCRMYDLGGRSDESCCCNWGSVIGGLNKSVLESVNLLYVLIGSIERDN